VGKKREGSDLRKRGKDQTKIEGIDSPARYGNRSTKHHQGRNDLVTHINRENQWGGSGEQAEGNDGRGGLWKGEKQPDSVRGSAKQLHRAEKECGIVDR